MINGKEAPKMTNVLTSIENIMDYCNDNENNDKKNDRYIDLLILYLKGKAIIKSKRSKKILKDYIIKINGKEVIKGTRLTHVDIVRIFDIKEGAEIQDFLDEYPSLENKYQIMAGLLLYIKKNCTIRNILFKS